VVLVAGLLAAFFGVAVGLTQENPKTVLAYSSISQMGFMTVAVGAGLFDPETWPIALAAILVYATHHALAKGALFLGVGVAQETDGSRRRRQRILVVAGLLLASLAIAAAPLTSGAAAKAYLKSAVELTPYYGVLSSLLDFASVGSALIMARFMLFVWPRAGTREGGAEAGLWVSWLASVGGVAALILFLPDPIAALPGLVVSVSALWPVALGTLLAAGAWLLNRRSDGKLRARFEPKIPEGDLIVPMSGLLGRIRSGWKGRLAPAWGGLMEGLGSRRKRFGSDLGRLQSAASGAEARIRYWTVAGSLFALLVAALLVLSALT
jgi:hypothetical protein